jgi:hypothetical protein
MSYRCQNCKEIFGSGERPERTVVKTRERRYENTSRVGWEVVEEKLCCTPCSLRIDARIATAPKQRRAKPVEALEEAA